MQDEKVEQEVTSEQSEHPLVEFKPQRDEDFQEIEQRDFNQIIAMMRGEVVGDFFYEYQLSGQKVVSISAAGVFECQTQMGAIEVESLEKLSPDYEKISEMAGLVDKGLLDKNKYEQFVWREVNTIRYKAKAVDTKSATSHWGIGDKILTGDVKRDQFFDRAAATIAQKNAIRPMIPLPLIRVLYAEYVANKQRSTYDGEPDKLCVKGQVKQIELLTDETRQKKICGYFKVDSLDKLTYQQAVFTIGKLLEE